MLSALPDARLVGGCVRDVLANHRVTDIDLGTRLRPDAVMQALAAAGLRAIGTGLSHGTVTALADRRTFEITTLRCDVQTDGRHAVVAFTDDWEQDAARRDFTFNALSMAPDGDVYDYFGGIADLAAGRVRFVGDPPTRIAEDRLRVLRFFRFYARFGRVPAEPKAEQAMAEAVPMLGLLSAERVWSELRGILAADDPRAALTLMQRLGVLAAVVPEGTDLPRLQRLLGQGAPADPLLRLAALLAGNTDHLADRLRLSGAERERLVALGAPAPPAWVASDTLRQLLAETSAELLIARSWLAGPGWADLRDRIANMPVPVFPLAGRDVLALGVAPGPAVGALLGRVRSWWLAGGCRADAGACRAELGRQVAGGSLPGVG